MRAGGPRDGSVLFILDPGTWDVSLISDDPPLFSTIAMAIAAPHEGDRGTV
ncbi:MAG: hypothetical protein ACJAYU_005157 [Bradymonadia bacterium]